MKTRISIFTFFLFSAWAVCAQENNVALSGGYPFAGVKDTDLNASGWRMDDSHELNPSNGKFGNGHSVAPQNDAEKKWKFLVEPYMMFPSMSGTTGIRNLPEVDVDANAGDIFSKLQFGAMLYLEAQTDKWAITSDLLYMDLSQDATPSTLINSGEVSAKQLGYELAGLYRIAPFLESGVGLRLNSISSEVDIVRNTVGAGTEAIDGSLSRAWIDPVLIARATGDIDDKWLFVFRGDFGGFGVGSAFTWQVQGYAGYRFSKLFQTSIGYRIIGIDYDKGSGADRFRYNMNTFGPNIRLGFNL